MTDAITLPAFETALRDWLRSETVGAAGARIYAGGLPNNAVLPAIAFRRVGGGTQGAIDVPLIQFDIHAASGAQTEQVERALISLLLSTPAGTPLAAGVTFGGATDESSLWSPDPADGPRRILTVEMTIKAT